MIAQETQGAELTSGDARDAAFIHIAQCDRIVIVVECRLSDRVSRGGSSRIGREGRIALAARCGRCCRVAGWFSGKRTDQESINAQQSHDHDEEKEWEAHAHRDQRRTAAESRATVEQRTRQEAGNSGAEHSGRGSREQRSSTV